MGQASVIRAEMNDCVPDRRDLWRLVEYYGSIETVADALFVPVNELEDWLGGMKPIPYDQHAAIRALIAKMIEKR